MTLYRKLTLVVAMFAFGISQAMAQDFKMKYAHGYKTGSAHDVAAQEFKSIVEDKSKGRIAITIYPDAQLGDSRELFEQTQLNVIQGTAVPSARISGFIPELQIFDLPFLFPDRQQMYEILDGEIGDQLLTLLEPQGVVGAAFYVEGMKNMTGNRQLLEPKDFDGFKMRTMESSIIQQQYSVLGADPVVIAFPELYSSLQLGTVDGQENPINLIHNMKFYEVQDFLMLTEHAPLAGPILFAKPWFDSLPEDLQTIVLDAAKVYAKQQRKNVEALEAEMLETISENLEVLSLTASQIREFQAKTRSVHSIYTEQFGDIAIKKIYAATE